MNTTLEELETFIKLKSNKKSRSQDEDFNVYDWSGGNIDDAFSLGMDDGEIFFAREILKKIQELKSKL
jgi:hypothetical protein